MQAARPDAIVEHRVTSTPYTLSRADVGKLIQMDVAIANVVEVPVDASENMPIGATIEVQQLGVGLTTVTPDSGVTLVSPNGNRAIAVRYGVVALRKKEPNLWEMEGRLSLGGSEPPLVVLGKTASYTLEQGDAGKVILMNVGSANTLTVPANSAVPFVQGTTVEVVQYGSGTTSIAPDSGVTLHSPDGQRDIGVQFGTVALTKVDVDTWLLEGRLA
jgi:hypothetical protein